MRNVQITFPTDLTEQLLDLRHLRSFAAVARTGSFTAAAGQLGYTQSAVSQHVAALEADLGRQLLTRRPVRLTVAGEQLAAHADQILLRVDTARTEMASPLHEVRVTRLAASPGAVVHPLLAGLRRTRTGGTVELEIVDAAEALRLVAQGSVDGAVVDGVTVPSGPVRPAEPGLFRHHLVAELPLEVLLPSGHPLAGQRALNLETIADARWIDAPNLPCDASAIPDAPRIRIGTRFRYLGRDTATIARLVAAGDGLAILPEGVAPPVPGLARVRLERPPVVHRTELLVLPAIPAGAAVLVAAAGAS